MAEASGGMNNRYGKCEQHYNDITVKASLHNQNQQGDSLCSVSCDQVCNCEPQQQWESKPDPYLQLEQDLTPDMRFESELPASTLNLHSQHDQDYQDIKPIVSTQHQEYQADISMAFSKEYNG